MNALYLTTLRTGAASGMAAVVIVGDGRGGHSCRICWHGTGRLRTGLFGDGALQHVSQLSLWVEIMELC